MKSARFATTLAGLFLITSPVQAADVVIGLFPHYPSFGRFVIFARVLGDDNAGLAGYGMDLIGNVLTIDHLSPRDSSAMKGSLEGPTGFTSGRSADNVTPPIVRGFQDLANPESIPVYGIGQGPGSFAAQGIDVGGSTLEGATWGKSVILATGTFVGTLEVNQAGPNKTANVFNNTSGKSVRAPDSYNLHGGFLYGIDFFIPEPATHSLLCVAALCLAARRRSRGRRPRSSGSGWRNYVSSSRSARGISSDTVPQVL
jgi:hypothetical protein